MKIVTIRGEWTVFDGEKEINTTDGAVVFGYALTMMQIRPIPYTNQPTYPVLSLVPHPKKRRLTKKYRERIRKIKATLPACNL